jgi:hypothetical protein
MPDPIEHEYLVKGTSGTPSAGEVDDALARNSVFGQVTSSPEGVIITTRAGIDTIRGALKKVPGIVDILEHNNGEVAGEDTGLELGEADEVTTPSAPLSVAGEMAVPPPLRQ